MRRSMTAELLEIDELRRLRRDHRLGGAITFLPSTDSTNTRARDLARSGAAEGTVVIAEEQSAGRGRLGRSWSSPPGLNLYLSVILRPSVALEVVPQLTLVAGVAAALTAREWVADAGIKWPNDIVVRGKKTGGILTEMEAAEGQVAFVVVGIGLNLNIRPEQFPPELREHAGALSWFTGTKEPIARHRFADRLLSQLEQAYETFVRSGFGALRDTWNELSLLTGRSVRIDSSGQISTGTVIGLDADGALLLRDESGSEKRVVAADVTVLDGYR